MPESINYLHIFFSLFLLYIHMFFLPDIHLLFFSQIMHLPFFYPDTHLPFFLPNMLLSFFLPDIHLPFCFYPFSILQELKSHLDSCLTEGIPLLLTECDPLRLSNNQNLCSIIGASKTFLQATQSFKMNVCLDSLLIFLITNKILLLNNILKV